MDDYIIAGLTVLVVSICVGLVRTFLFGLLGMPGVLALAIEETRTHYAGDYGEALRNHHARKRAARAERAERAAAVAGAARARSLRNVDARRARVRGLFGLRG